MKHDLFEFNADMTWRDKAWRVLFLLVIVGILLCDLYIWRP